jgi:hypothetical protein
MLHPGRSRMTNWYVSTTVLAEILGSEPLEEFYGATVMCSPR